MGVWTRIGNAGRKFSAEVRKMKQRDHDETIKGKR